jgi:CHAD domain-containing protein
MPYHLKRSEALPEGITRIVSEELESAIQELTVKSQSRHDNATHEARKSIKKVRAVLKLVREDLGEVYEQENTRLKEVGRVLSEIRDAATLMETFKKVIADSEKKSLNKPAQESICRALAAHKAHVETEKAPARILPDAAKSLEETLKGIKHWTLNSHGFGAIEDAFKNTFRRGRKALRKVEQNGRPEDYHDLRKRVKDHWYHVRLLEPIWQDFMEGYEKSLKTLETNLGEDHDLVVLHDVVSAAPAVFGKSSGVDALFSEIDRQQKALREEALITARLVYKERPGRLAKRVNRMWGIWKKSA